MQDFEKLGVFYMGREYDLDAGRAGTQLVLYDSKDLVTHAVCVGMTGSGKTGLCLTLLEEAAIDGIPALVIDPKGDLANLLLTFPKLEPGDFLPWVNEDDARRKGQTKEEFARSQSELWEKGLAEWGQDGARIQRLRDAADLLIYTPGSTAGIPLNVLKSFDAPEASTLEDPELLRDRIQATVSSLLGLLNIQADPLQSREHILLSAIINQSWKEARSLDLAGLIRLIQDPPVQRIGAFELESFYPAKERFSLAMQLNNLLASPGFEAWITGEPLSIDQMLYTAEGKPRIAIISIAHLSDTERMFVVSLVLNQVLSWVRSLPGTTSLKAIVYMDEIFGYFPPVANPPSKLPLLTLLKQARAYGVGVVLATQNPVDLDYKGLANAGTWFIGRLQTERDKARVIEGLEGAAGGFGQQFDRSKMEKTLAGLGNRLFLMNNVHEDGPVVFQVRWALSYLRGPITRNQIKALMDPRKNQTVRPSGSDGASVTPAGSLVNPSTATTASLPRAAQAPVPNAAAGNTVRPLLPSEIPQYFLPVRLEPPPNARLLYRPALLGMGKVYFVDLKNDVEHEEECSLLEILDPDSKTVHFDHALDLEISESELEHEPSEDATFGPLPAAATKPKSYETWKKALVDALYRGTKLELFHLKSLKLASRPGESERDFMIRARQSTRESRDDAVEQLKKKYQPKFDTLRDKRVKAELVLQRESDQATKSHLETVINLGSTVLGALFSRKKLSSSTLTKAATSARGATKSLKDQSDVSRAKLQIEDLDQQIAELDERFRAEVSELDRHSDPISDSIEIVLIRPKKTNIRPMLVALTWAPHWRLEDGAVVPAWSGLDQRDS